MALPADGTTLSSASIYELTAPGSINAQATINNLLATTLAPLGSGLYIADQLSLSNTASFSTVNGVTSITYPDPTAPGGTTTISNVSITQEGSTGFTFSAAGGGTYYLSTQPIGSTASIDVNTTNNLVVATLAPTLDSLVGPNPTIFVGSTNTPASLDGQGFIACFLRGTLIATPAGERPVEDLAIGSEVVTATGAVKTVLWVGRRSYASMFVGANPAVLPVRIAAGALDDNLPRRDLLVSPCHAVLIDGMLVPAGDLVNGTSVTSERGLETIDYFHIELEDHDIVLAEGVACETFVDHDSRMAFQNAAEYLELYADREDREPVFCAPRVTQGARLEAVRRRIADRVERSRVQRVA